MNAKPNEPSPDAPLMPPWVPVESNDELSPYEGERLRDALVDVQRNGVDA